MLDYLSNEKGCRREKRPERESVEKKIKISSLWTGSDVTSK